MDKMDKKDKLSKMPRGQNGQKPLLPAYDVVHVDESTMTTADPTTDPMMAPYR